MKQDNSSGAAPRKWTLAYDTNFDSILPVVIDGPNISGYEMEVAVIEYSAYEALQKDRDQWKTLTKHNAGLYVQRLAELESERDRAKQDAKEWANLYEYWFECHSKRCDENASLKQRITELETNRNAWKELALEISKLVPKDVQHQIANKIYAELGKYRGEG